MTTASTRRRGVIPVLTEAQRLMIAREYVGLNQGELAERLGVGTATVQRAESGKTKPRRTTFMAWSMATGVDLEWLEKGTTADGDPDGGGDVVRPKGFEPLTFWSGVHPLSEMRLSGSLPFLTPPSKAA
ncbi:transcriptional regulator, y4mF family [Mycobacteroides abscessus subsp. bolletii]|nr:transcriptional regulator, y4mF family [Mycobacteroides abscessus subsp. bolletii]